MDLVATMPVYDVAAVADLFCIRWTASERASFRPPPAPRAKLLTFFDPGKSILWLHDAVAGEHRLFYPTIWHTHEPFAAVEEAPRYRRVRLEPLRRSAGKTYQQQCALLTPGEEVPTARVLITALLIHFLLTGERLFTEVAVRCRDHSMHGRVCVRFDKLGVLLMDYWRDGVAYPAVGLTSSRTE